MSYLVRQLEKAFEWSNDPMLNDAAEEITALSARVAELEAERDDLSHTLMGRGSETGAAPRLVKRAFARAEAAEALLSEAVKEGMLEGARACNDRGGAEQVNYGLNRGTQNYFRARDVIRALADDPETIARIVAQVKEGRG